MRFPYGAGVRFVSGLLLPAMLCSVVGCAPRIDLETAFESAHARAKAGEWPAAMDETKALLLAYPDLGTAHFLLGQCYLYGTPPNLVQAQGELRTAWEIFRRDETFVPWEDEMSRDAYALKLHTVMAALHMRWVSEALRIGVSFERIRRRIEDELMPHIRTGLKLDPANAFMLEMKKAVDELLATGGRAVPAPVETPSNPSEDGPGNVPAAPLFLSRRYWASML